MRAGKRFTWFTSNEDTNNIIKIRKSLEDYGVWINGVTETVKHGIKKKEEWWFLEALFASFTASIAQPVISSLIKSISGGGVRRAERGYTNKHFLFHSSF